MLMDDQEKLIKKTKVDLEKVWTEKYNDLEVVLE